jgi:2-oxoisovalerate dehydrogenase E1 component beta subunit
MQRLTRTSRAVHSCRQFATTSQRSSSDDNPPPAGGHAPSVANSSYLKRTKEEALGTRGLVWRDEAVVGVGKFEKREMIEGKERETKKMNMYQAIRDAMSQVSFLPGL